MNVQNLEIIENYHFFETITSIIHCATFEVVIVSFLASSSEKYFIPLLIELEGAWKRNVKIYVILNGSFRNTITKKTNEEFLKRCKPFCAGTMLTRKTTTEHRKIVLVDRKRVLLGSHNLSRNSLRANREISLLIQSRELAEQIHQSLQTDYPEVLPLPTPLIIP